MILATIMVSLSFVPCHDPMRAGCYDYSSGVVHLDPEHITPYLVTHEVGHAVYFQRLSPAQRRMLAVRSPGVRPEEAFADVYAACALGRGPRWLRSNGYRVSVGIARFRRICRFVAT